MAVKTPELPGIEEANRLASMAADLENQVTSAVEPFLTDSGPMAQMAAASKAMAVFIRHGLDSHVHAFNDLAEQNEKLRVEVQKLRAQSPIDDDDDEDADDDHFFGTNIRHAWHALLGR